MVFRQRAVRHARMARRGNGLGTGTNRRPSSADRRRFRRQRLHHDELLAYYLARETGRPVQMAMSQTEDFIAGVHRHGATIRMKSGVDENGTLLAREVQLTFNNGTYASLRPRMTLETTPRAAKCYRIPNTRIISTCVYTNQVPC